MDLILVRHGNDDRTIPARPLSSTGKAQADAAGRWLAGHRPTELWSATPSRARETAEHIAQHVALPVRFDVRLDEIVSAAADLPPPRERSPWQHHADAESWTAFRCRVAASLNDLCAQRGPAVVVTHSGVFDAVHEIVCGGDRRVELDIAHTGMTWWKYRQGAVAGTWLLRAHNITPHLATSFSAPGATAHWQSNHAEPSAGSL
ncbi:histidine phosphatase family protein [Lentzea flaviverrucosa]|uniref:Broad specificity phosphatase PhoE n=1 Tax=Lentzea flaviverrucosa TaxID=200379 RepID=A0A1H9WTP8_9PSEU|nr:histidine phosphatase family protein [Lentzea flaviverrucosa]RDI23086.1 broad specificity phosphatase PhoE [Lentzea flaviverrucosa]SES37171.1 Broad specificity phosphatase PhoE [Lentzea flaviverrucosa]